MHRFIKTCQIVLTIAFAAVSLETVHATFPGENGVIVYHVAGRMYKIAADGSGSPTLLIDYGVEPSVSPNGKQVAFNAGARLYVMNIDGSNLTDMGQSPMAHPVWSPDGTKIAFVKPEIGGDSIYLLDVATKQASSLIRTSVNTMMRMSWSPRGDQILYWGDYIHMYVVDVASGQSTAVPWYFSNPAWFPDYMQRVVGADPNNDNCVYKRSLDSTVNQSFSSCSLRYPTVSPDGSMMAAAGSESPTNFYLSIRAVPSGTGVKNIAYQGDQADWSRVPKTAMRSTLSNNQWSPATPLVDDDAYISQGDFAVMPDGGSIGRYLRQEVIVGVDGRVYHRAQRLDGTWTAFAVAPGINRSASGFIAKRVAIAGALNGSAQVIAVGADDNAYHTMRYADGSWSGFALLDGWSGSPNFAARDLDIDIVNSTYATPGQAHVVGNGLRNGDVYHRVRLDDGSWTPWAPISAETAQTNQVAIAFDAGANAYVLTTSPTQGVMRRVRYPNGNWNTWVHMPTNGAYPLKDVSLIVNSALASAWVSYIGFDGGVWTQKIDNPLLDASWTQPLSAPTHVMDKGRTVSIGISANAGPEVVVVQIQPQ